MTEAKSKKPMTEAAKAELIKQNPQLEALDDAREFTETARTTLAEFDKVQTFEMAGIATGKSGEETKVLIIDTDRAIMSYLEGGNPFEFDETGHKTDKPLLAQYVREMANINLTDVDSLKQCGLSAIEKARAMVASFFMLSMVAAMEIPDLADL